jgi:hypothetical protein
VDTYVVYGKGVATAGILNYAENFKPGVIPDEPERQFDGEQTRL